METEVLGTHFNVNAYADENEMSVTLLEGRVKVKEGNVSMIISPGQQVTSNQGMLNKNATVNLDQVMAWKNGRFLTGTQDVEIITFFAPGKSLVRCGY